MNQTNTVSAPRTKTYEITITALMAAVTCILAPLSIPIGPVPISFTNLAIYCRRSRSWGPQRSPE